MNSMSLDQSPTHGVTTVNLGVISYSPNMGYVGQDVLIYKICSMTNPLNCVTAKEWVTINAPSALNSTVGVDDFSAGLEGDTITSNVLLNDSDPEGDIQSVVPQGSPSSRINMATGSYYFLSDGTFNFIPIPGFVGPTEVVYTVCDNQPTPFCTKATMKLLVMPDLRLQIRVYLEGALMNNSNAKGPDNRPLMRDQLRNNGFTGQNYLPSNSPYSFGSTFVNIANKYQKFGPGLLPSLEKIANPTTVFNVAGQDAIVDWVFVELRDKENYSTLIASRSGLLQRDGDIVDVDGVNYLTFPGISLDSFYVVVRHRNHLGVMSMKVSNRDLVDFTNPSTQVFDFGTTLADGYNYTGLAQKANVVYGYRALWAGDFDADGKIKFVNPNDDHNVLFFDVFAYPNNLVNSANYNFGYGYLQGDYNLDGKTKYDNPNDDKNLLFAQLLLQPLNTNLLSNFNYFNQQVPVIIIQ
jgi:hypothetical protein